MTDRTYNDLTLTVQIVLPAFASLYFIADAIWELPIVVQTLGIIAIISFFLGIVLHVMSDRYASGDDPYSGDIVVSKGQNGSTLYSIELNESPEEFEHVDSVTFKVIRK